MADRTVLVVLRAPAGLVVVVGRWDVAVVVLVVVVIVVIVVVVGVLVADQR